MNPFPRTWLEIHLNALAENLAWIRSRLPAKTQLGIVTKADGYGHGLIAVGRYAANHGADWICVATIQEGVALRDAGVQAPILVISPFLPVEAEQAVFYDLSTTIEREEIAEALARAAAHQAKRAKVHVEFDTGLSRFGATHEDAVRLATRISQSEHLELEGVCQHFVDSGGNPERTTEQARLFQDLVQELADLGIHPKYVHAANSAGALKFSGYAFDLVRVGILAYGIDPYEMSGGNVKPVLHWKARVTALREVPAGATIGYSETYRTPERAVIATLGVGYGDGYPRALSNRASVHFCGQQLPVVGSVCMDQMMVDASQVSIALGDEVELLGDHISAVQLAQWSQTITHEVITRVTPRVPKRYQF